MEHLSNSVEASWAVGADGMHFVYTHGVLYMITFDDSKPEEVADIMQEEYVIFCIHRARNELLTVLKMIDCSCKG